MTVVIPSYNRPGRVLAAKVFPDAVLVVPKGQEAAYRDAGYTGRLLAIPDERDGSVSKKRNACLDLVDDDEQFTVDDDFTGLARLPDLDAVPNDQVPRILENGFALARELGTALWGFGWSTDVFRMRAGRPISLTKSFYGAVGVVKTELRYDERLTLWEDTDFWLQNLQKFHKTLRFNEYVFQHSNAKDGGCSRSAAKLQASLELMTKKWGDAIIGRNDLGEGTVHSPIPGV